MERDTVAIGKTPRYGQAAGWQPSSAAVKAFAGPRDDPFFFDLVGFKHLKSRVLAGRQDLGTATTRPTVPSPMTTPAPAC